MKDQSGDQKNQNQNQNAGQAGTSDTYAQKLAQRLTTTDRRVDVALSGIGEIRDMLREQSSSQSQADGNAIDKAFEDIDGEEGLTPTALKGVMESLAEQVSKKVDDALSPISKRLDSVTQTQEDHRYQSDWKVDHPKISGEFDGLWMRAEGLVDDRYGAVDLAKRGIAVQALFDQLVDQREAQVKSGDGKPSTDPPQSTEGTEITPTGATGNVGQHKDDKPIGPLWDPD